MTPSIGSRNRIGVIEIAFGEEVLNVNGLVHEYVQMAIVVLGDVKIYTQKI